MESSPSQPSSSSKFPRKNVTEKLRKGRDYCAREDRLKQQEEAGNLKILCLSSDGIDEHMIWLIELKNIYASQFPDLPKEYIVRLVMDRSHKSLMLIRRNKVIGGITYRTFLNAKFGEIALCAVQDNEQSKGYGTRLMNHLKQHARDVEGLTHLLTCLYPNAAEFFTKQGFSQEIHLDKHEWEGYIKEYEGRFLMGCEVYPKVPYTDLSAMIRLQKQAVCDRIRQVLSDDATYQKELRVVLRWLLKSMKDHEDAWPFIKPVDAEKVPDYYDIIKEPMDLETMSKRVESEDYYVTLEMFVADASRMFANARAYNPRNTVYYKCSERLEAYFQSQLRSARQ